MMLLYVAFLVAPELARGPVLLIASVMVVVVAFTSVELTLYLLIFATLLSPELIIGGGVSNEIVAGRVSTTESRGVTLRLDDILLSLVCLTWLFRMAIYKELGSFRQTPINQPIAWYWMAAFFSTLIGFYFGKVGIYGFFFVLKYLEYFLLFYMVINNLHDDATIKRYLVVLLFTCLMASLVGMSQIPSGLRVSAPFEGSEGEPNTFGGYLMLMFSIVLGIFLYTPKGKRRLMLLTMMGVILVPFAFTESRSSYLSLIASMGLFLFYSEKKRFLIGAALVSIVVLPVILPQNVIDRVMFTFTQADEVGQLKVAALKIDTTTSERLKSWENVLTKQFPQNPVLGVGVTGGGFLDAQYPRILLESGLIGLILFIWFLRRIWIMLKQCYAEIEDDIFKGAALGTICGFGGLLVHAIGANTFIIVRIMEPFMIIIGLLFAALIVQHDKSEVKNMSDENLQSEPVR